MNKKYEKYHLEYDCEAPSCFHIRRIESKYPILKEWVIIYTGSMSSCIQISNTLRCIFDDLNIRPNPGHIISLINGIKQA